MSCSSCSRCAARVVAAEDKLAALHEELTGYVPPYRPDPGHLGFAVPLQLRTGGGLLTLRDSAKLGP
jgi:hypothetical protein